MQANGDIGIEVRDAKVPPKLAKLKIHGLEGKPNLKEIGTAVDQLKAVVPTLNTALIQPQALVYRPAVENFPRSLGITLDFSGRFAPPGVKHRQ